VTSLTGYSRSLPAVYCGVPASHGTNESFDSEVVRTVLPPYSDEGHLTPEYKLQSASVVSDAMSLQLLPNASTSSSDSSTSSSTWRPPTSTTKLWSSSQRPAALTGPRDGSVPPATRQGRPLPAPPVSHDGDYSLELGDDLTAIPRLDRSRLRHIDSLGVGHFGEVSHLPLIICLHS